MGTKFKHTRFQRLRRKFGYSQEDLADILRVEVSTIKKWESGASSPSPDRVKQIAKVLKCNSPYLMGSNNPHDNPDYEEPTSSKSGLGFIVLLILLAVAVYGISKILPSII